MIRRFIDSFYLDVLAFVILVLVAVSWSIVAFGQVPPGAAPGAGYPSGTTPLENGAVGTTAGATATLAGSPGQYTWLCGFSYSPGSATTAIVTTVTTTGLASNFTIDVGAPATAAGVTGSIIIHPIAPCVRASAANTAITVVGSALGAGGAGQTVNAWGYSIPVN